MTISNIERLLTEYAVERKQISSAIVYIFELVLNTNLDPNPLFTIQFFPECVQIFTKSYFVKYHRSFCN